MTFRLPGRPAPNLWQKTPASALDYEIAQETASALGRQGRALEAALRELSEFDRGPNASADPGQRAALVATAAQALWAFVVQREACGLRDGGMIMRMYKVPAEVRDRMGAFPSARR